MASKGNECCGNCGNMSKSLKKCSVCKDVKYCSSDCQKEHWNEHKEHCKSKKSEKWDHNRQEDAMLTCLEVSNKLGESVCDTFNYCNGVEEIAQSLEVIDKVFANGKDGKNKKSSKFDLDKLRSFKHLEDEAVQDYIKAEKKSASREMDDPYGDGDQSQLKMDANIKMRHNWGSGMGYHPALLSEFAQACFFGSFVHVKRLVETSDDPRLVEKRESYMRLPAIIHCIAGARSLKDMKVAEGGEHLKCFKYLVKERKVRLDCRDIAGMTPLHHCLSSQGNANTKQMARILLERGVDPDARNRMGEGPIFEIVMIGQLEYFDLLLEFGVNVDVNDYSGTNLIFLTQLYPELQKRVCKAMNKSVKNIRAEAKAERPGCANCESRENLKHCGQCYDVRYCGPQCQKEHWKSHKKACKEERANYKSISLIEYTGGMLASFNFRNKTVSSGSGWTTLPDAKMQFVVKVQVPHSMSKNMAENGQPAPTGALMLYNKDNSLSGFVSSDCPWYDIMVATVQGHKYTVLGAKGYMSAMYEPGTGVSVNVFKLVAPEKW